MKFQRYKVEIEVDGTLTFIMFDLLDDESHQRRDHLWMLFTSVSSILASLVGIYFFEILRIQFHANNYHPKYFETSRHYHLK